MLTFGVDLASQDRLTAGCLVDWLDRPLVVEVMHPLSDEVIVRWARDPEVGVTAIDAPFGWPHAFVDALAKYGLGQPFPEPIGNLWLRSEVYPAAALAVWQIASGRYKRPDGVEARRALLRALVEALPGLDVGDHGPTLVATDHAIDALIAALVGRAHMLGQVRRPTDAQAKDAAVEGWIWLPDRPARFLLGTNWEG